MGVANDAARAALPEDFRQAYRGHRSGTEHVQEKASRSHAGQLIGVAHKDQPAVRRQRLQKRLNEYYVNHRALVEDHSSAGKRIVLVFAEHQVVAVAGPGGAKQTVDRVGLAACELGHPLGRSPRGRGQQAVQTEPVVKLQHGADDGGFPRARPSGQRHEPAPGGQIDGSALPIGVPNAVFPLYR